MLKRLGIALIIILPYGLWFAFNPLPGFTFPSISPSKTPKSHEPLKPKPDPAKYRTLIDDLANERQRLATQHAAAGSTAEKELIEAEARTLLDSQLPQLMRCWLGTPWDFNGISETPGEGEIACGYFVSTVLRDAGFEVERFNLARQASQNIIRTFLARDEIHIRTATPYEDFLQQVIARGPGVRIVGLDTHVAFLIVNPDLTINFIHSSGARPWTVVDEDPPQARVLANSNYRVTGNLTSSPKVIRQWLAQTPWPTKTS